MLFSIPFDCSYYDTIILMYGGFADAEFLSCGADSGPVFDDVKSQILGTLFHVSLHKHNTPRVLLLQIYAWKKQDMSERREDKKSRQKRISAGI